MVRIVELQLGGPFASRARKLRLIIWLVEFRIDGALESSQTSLPICDQVTQKRSADSVHDRAVQKQNWDKRLKQVTGTNDFAKENDFIWEQFGGSGSE